MQIHWQKCRRYRYPTIHPTIIKNDAGLLIGTDQNRGTKGKIGVVITHSKAPGKLDLTIFDGGSHLRETKIF